MTRGFRFSINPQLFAITAEKLLTDTGVDILYGTYAVGVDMKDDKINHIICENKSGRLAYKVNAVVDASGDCDIAKFADAPTDTFKQGNVLAAWYLMLSGKTDMRSDSFGCTNIPDEEKTAQERGKAAH